MKPSKYSQTSPLQEDAVWQYPIDFAAVSPKGATYAIAPPPQLLPALAQAFGLSALCGLKASLKVYKSGRFVKIHGEVEAEVVQNCVVSLEPVKQRVREAIAVRFAARPERAGAKAKERPEALMDLMDEELPEYAENGKIDLAAIACEHFVLGIDPYPRKKGVRFFYPEQGFPSPKRKPQPKERTDGEAPSAFAALARLKRKDEA